VGGAAAPNRECSNNHGSDSECLYTTYSTSNRWRTWSCALQEFSLVTPKNHYYYYYYKYYSSNDENILKEYTRTNIKLRCSVKWGEPESEGNANHQGTTDKQPSDILS
jgi:hypothetical protein